MSKLTVEEFMGIEPENGTNEEFGELMDLSAEHALQSAKVNLAFLAGYFEQKGDVIKAEKFLEIAGDLTNLGGV